MIATEMTTTYQLIEILQEKCLEDNDLMFTIIDEYVSSMNEDELNKLLENDSQTKTIYERNRLLIDFDMIPYELKEGFYDMYKL